MAAEDVLTWGGDQVIIPPRLAAKPPRPLELFDWKRVDDEVATSLGPEVGGTMPPSPDTVCFERFTMLGSEPLVLDKSSLVFDPNMFLNEKPNPTMIIPAFPEDEEEHEMFKIFDSIPDETYVADDIFRERQERIRTPEQPFHVEARDVEQPKTSPKKPVAKRMKSFSSDTSEDSEASHRVKKTKSSPVKPRSRQATSKFRGVSRCTKDGRWQARIRIAKSVVYLGRFPTEEQAALRYDEAAREHHGAQAMLNFINAEDVQLGRKSIFDKSAKSKPSSK